MQCRYGDYTRRIDGFKNLNYWQRLEKIRLFSIQRGNERYKLLFLWKAMNGMVPDIGVKRVYDGRRGYVITIPPLTGSVNSVKTMREKSLPISAAKLYNSLPYYIRDYEGDDYKTFKAMLDEFLSSIPDEPSVPGLSTSNQNTDSRPSNSIIDWSRNMRNSSWTPATLQSVPDSNIV